MYRYISSISTSSYVELFNTDKMSIELPESGYPREFMIRGEPYNTLEKPAICMHGNLGVTFDLDQIRSSLAG